MPNPVEEIRQLREKKLTPKQIARKLGMKVSEVSSIIRAEAEAETQALEASGALPPLFECLINAYAAERLLGIPRSPNEEGEELPGDDPSQGLGIVLVSRQLPRGRLSTAGFLIDYWCLGVKDAIPPRQTNEVEYRLFVNANCDRFNSPMTTITLEQAQSVIWGAVDYAKSLGFDPHFDFKSAKELLGDRPDPLPVEIEFGRDGKPFYVAGPYDNSAKVFKTLQLTQGEDFNYIMPVE
ncbi:MAG: helix-turn-helix transcriptional regulator [Synechococcales bacterium]|nr:helix-turn-helix transcriptional regulator [Synechococcales bacterium]